MSDMKPWLTSVVAATVALAAGCATTGDTAAFRPEPGTTVEVTKRLDFSDKSTRLYIQGGRRVHRRDVDRLVASCSIGLDPGRDGRPRVNSVRPGAFTVGETRLSMRVARALPRELVRVAAAGDPAPLQVAQPDGGPAIHLYDTIIALHSEEQPQVAELTCSYDGGPFGGHLTRAEIQRTLGDLVRFY